MKVFNYVIELFHAYQTDTLARSAVQEAGVDIRISVRMTRAGFASLRSRPLANQSGPMLTNKLLALGATNSPT